MKTIVRVTLFIATALVLATHCMGCTPRDSTAKAAVEKLGMTDVKVGGPSFFSCGEDDLTGASFTATNPAGQRVEGVVCCGVFKACTVRF